MHLHFPQLGRIGTDLVQGTFVHIEERIFTYLSDDDPVPVRHYFHRKDEHNESRDKAREGVRQ